MSASSGYGTSGGGPVGPTIDTITGNVGGAVGPDGANNINFIGAGGVLVTGNPGLNTLTITVSGIATQYNEDVGNAVPAAGILNIVGGASTAGTNIHTTGAGNTVSVILNDSILLPDTNAAGTHGVIFYNGRTMLHNFGGTLGGADANTFVGSGAGNLTSTTAQDNTIVGFASGRSLTTGSANTGVGENCFANATTAFGNSGFGQGSFLNLISGDYNTALGYFNLFELLSGNFNTAAGVAYDHILAEVTGAGAYYTNNESSNVVIQHTGVAGESHVLRIGTDGSGDTEQNACYIAGIYNRAFAAPSGVVQIDSNFKLGSSAGTDGQLLIGDTGGSPVWANLTSVGGTVTITNGAGTINLEAIGGGGGGTVAFPTDAGTANEVAGVVNIFSGATSAFNNMNTSASGNTVRIKMNDSIAFPNTNAAGTTGLYSLGGNRFMHKYGVGNTFLGENAGNLTLTPGSSFDNVGIGQNTLSVLTTSPENTFVGSQAGTALASGTGVNTGIGFGALDNLVSGTANIAIGPLAGTSYVGAESNNILINNFGTAAESGVIRIGRSGVQTAAYMAGIYGASIGTTNQPVFIDNTGKLGAGSASTASGVSLLYFITTNDDTGGTSGGGNATYFIGTNQIMTQLFDFFQPLFPGSFFPGNGIGSQATFTAPVNGLYQINWTMNSLIPGGVSIQPASVEIRINGGDQYKQIRDNPGTVSGFQTSGSLTVAPTTELTSGDVVDFSFTFGGSGTGGSGKVFLAGSGATPAVYQTYVNITLIREI